MLQIDKNQYTPQEKKVIVSLIAILLFISVLGANSNWDNKTTSPTHKTSQP